MKLPEHLTLSFLLAQLGARQEFGPAGTALVVAAGVLPDLDTLTLLGGWRAHRTYHRVLGHGLPVIVGGPLMLTWLGEHWVGTGDVFSLWCWLQISLLAHLVTDVLFYNWPVQLGWPLSRWGVAFGLLTWNDLVPTLLLYSGTAITVLWPAAAFAAAALSITALGLYLAWRPRSRSGWAAWLTGDWARRSPRWSRWLTGDFIT